eukprot:TRINITY_DN5445_c0_g2_i1.p1 TRINITY_DN5445_c0_g2~~TRINITY_DN5445_c0_g2_i1.p1  ORF type:complete len:336 (-),score=58.45 TRINITY_DN5445_c0_g2_i1:245-1252(-)
MTILRIAKTVILLIAVVLSNLIPTSATKLRHLTKDQQADGLLTRNGQADVSSQSSTAESLQVSNKKTEDLQVQGMKANVLSGPAKVLAPADKLQQAKEMQTLNAAGDFMVIFADEGRQLSAAIFYCVVAFLCLGLAMFVVCFVFDTAASWMHTATFHACKRQVTRVQEGLMTGKDDLSLCPYCVRSILNTPNKQKVMFLCGHRFHLGCINQWFREHPQKAGCCPICDSGRQDCEPSVCPPCTGGEEATPTPLREMRKGDTGSMEFPGDTGSMEEFPRDEAQTFILQSLHRQYPHIITKECTKRWAECNAELWLSELECPRYSSIFGAIFKGFRPK